MECRYWTHAVRRIIQVAGPEYLMQNCLTLVQQNSGGNLAPSLGGTEEFFADQDDVFFCKNFHFGGKNFWWLFFSHRPGFSNFHWFSGPLLCYMSYMTLRTWPFPHKKNTSFYSFQSDRRLVYNCCRANIIRVDRRNLLKLLNKHPGKHIISIFIHEFISLTKINLCNLCYTQMMWRFFRISARPVVNKQFCY